MQITASKHFTIPRSTLLVFLPPPVDNLLPATPTVNNPKHAKPRVQRDVLVKGGGPGQKAVGIGWQARVKYYRAIMWRFLHEKAVDSIDVSMSNSISWSSALWSLQVASIHDLVLCHFISLLHPVYSVDSMLLEAIHDYAAKRRAMQLNLVVKSIESCMLQNLNARQSTLQSRQARKRT